MIQAPRMTVIKICGITRRADADAAVDCGVHALGFVLWRKSPRWVSLPTVAGIVRALPPLATPVGVFVDPSLEEIERAVGAGIRVAQIHGAVPDWGARQPPVPVLRAVHLAGAGEAGIEPDAPAGVTVLLDADDPIRHGGTGRAIDWKRARAVAAARTVVLAGGLTAANVAQAIIEVRPYGVDVSSGVEIEPGVKDSALIEQFTRQVWLASRGPVSALAEERM